MVVTHGALQPVRGRCALPIGNSDAVNRGHRALIDGVVTKAGELSLTSCVLTFEPHPREFFAPEAAPPRLTRLYDKLELMAAAGVQRVHVIRFDARFAALSAARFIEEVLVRGLRTAWLLVGRDFRFGAQRKGDFATLESHRLALEAMPDVAFDGERVSSSSVRAALQAGDFWHPERALGRPYPLTGKRVQRAKLRPHLGFPTAHIAPRQRPPRSRIYVVAVEGLAPAAASGGPRP